MMSDIPDDTQLAAYLAGELDELAARRIEARLSSDPELGRRLDRIHAAVLALRDPDSVTPPSGLRERIGERLDREAGAASAREAAAQATAAPTAAGAGPSDGRAGDPDPDRGESWWARASGGRRGGSLQSWPRPIGAAAAAVVAVALIGAGLLLLPPPHADDAAVDMDTADEGPRTLAGDDGPEDADMGAEAEEEAEAEAPAAMPEEGDVDDFDDSGFADRVEGEPIPRAQADWFADEGWGQLGNREAACREAVEEAAPGPVVPLRVRPTGDGELVYEVITAAASDDTLELPARITVESTDCEVTDVELNR